LQEHPTKPPQKGDSPEKQGATYERDKFTITKIDPHPCTENSLASFVSEEEMSDKKLDELYQFGYEDYTDSIPIQGQRLLDVADISMVDDLPTRWDWRERTPKAKATQVLQQGACGRCRTKFQYLTDTKSLPLPQMELLGFRGSNEHFIQELHRESWTL